MRYNLNLSSSEHLPILKFDQFHVKHFDAFEALHDRVKNESNSILGQVNNNIHSKRILKNKN